MVTNVETVEIKVIRIHDKGLRGKYAEYCDVIVVSSGQSYLTVFYNTAVADFLLLLFVC